MEECKFKYPERVIRDQALGQLSRHRYRVTPNNFVQTLNDFPWGMAREIASDEEEFRQSIRLDSRTHLGRLAISFAIADMYFPDLELFFGEVTDNACWRNLLHKWMDGKLTLTEEFVDRLLFREEPHAVIGVLDEGGSLESQIDLIPPFDDEMDGELSHPFLIRHDRWRGIAASTLMYRSWGKQENPEQALTLFQRVEALCPKALFFRFNKVHPLIRLGRRAEARSIVEELVHIRPTAKVLLLWQEFNGQEHPLTRETYGDELWQAIEATLRRRALQMSF